MRSPTLTRDRRSTVILGQVFAWLQAHWLSLFTGILALLVGVAIITPALYAFGLQELGGRIFAAYHLICAQIPSHSYFLFGYQMALCSRNLAIYGSLLVGSVLFRSLRGRVRALDWRLWLLTLIPITLDGGTQLFGWRESTWALRTLTGAIFGLGVCWFLLPHLEDVLGGGTWEAPGNPGYPATLQADVSTKAVS